MFIYTRARRVLLIIDIECYFVQIYTRRYIISIEVGTHLNTARIIQRKYDLKG